MGRGLLVFKGEEKAKKKKSKMVKHAIAGVSRTADTSLQLDVHDAELDGPTSEVDLNPLIPPLEQSSVHKQTTSSSSTTTPKILVGTGRITTSGTVVTGHGTRFSRELSNGDAVLVDVGQQQEMRVVTFRLSDNSLNMSSAFSTDVPHPTPFWYIPKPRDANREQRLVQQTMMDSAKQQERHAFDAYVSTSSSEVVYRERTEQGSYRMKRMTVDGERERSRTELLDLRSKKASDKYC